MFNAATDAEKLISQAACMMRNRPAGGEEIYMDADETLLQSTDKQPEE